MPKLLLGIGVLGAVASAYLFGPSLLRSAAPEKAAASESSAAPAAGDLRAELTESALTDRLNQRLAGQPLGSTPLGAATLTTLTARLRTGEMQLAGNAQVAGKNVPLTLASTLEVERGQPVVTVTDARAAGVPMPDPARRSIEDTLQQQVDQEVHRLSMQVKSVSIADGKIVLVGSKAP